MTIKCTWDSDSEMQVTRIGYFVHLDMLPNEQEPFRCVVVSKRDDLVALRQTLDEAIEDYDAETKEGNNYHENRRES